MPDVTPDDDNDGWLCYPPPARAGVNVFYETGRWFTTLRAEQLLAIEKAARLQRTFGETSNGLNDALDALRPAAPGTPE